MGGCVYNHQGVFLQCLSVLSGHSVDSIAGQLNESKFHICKAPGFIFDDRGYPLRLEQAIFPSSRMPNSILPLPEDGSEQNEFLH
jgi:hypothetical protein